MEEDTIAKKLIEHDGRFERVDKKLIEHDGKFERIDKKLLEHDERFESVDKKLLEHDGQFETITKKLLEHDEQFVQVRSEMGQFRNEANQRFDEIMVVLNRLDQERIFTTEWIKRIDKRVENLEKK